jgi:hypothetical protein
VVLIFFYVKGQVIIGFYQTYSMNIGYLNSLVRIHSRLLINGRRTFVNMVPPF